MNITLEISLWVIAVILGLIIIAVAVYLINFLTAMKAMTPAETGPINDTVWCIKDRFVNSCIFKGEQCYLMVDEGMSDENFKLEMDRIGISPDQITALISPVTSNQ
jgi:hypothetical protein